MDLVFVVLVNMYDELRWELLSFSDGWEGVGGSKLILGRAAEGR
jgi:hypothetical protein